MMKKFDLIRVKIYKSGWNSIRSLDGGQVSQVITGCTFQA